MRANRLENSGVKIEDKKSQLKEKIDSNKTENFSSMQEKAGKIKENIYQKEGQEKGENIWENLSNGLKNNLGIDDKSEKLVFLKFFSDFYANNPSNGIEIFEKCITQNIGINSIEETICLLSFLQEKGVDKINKFIDKKPGKIKTLFDKFIFKINKSFIRDAFLEEEKILKKEKKESEIKVEEKEEDIEEKEEDIEEKEEDIEEKEEDIEEKEEDIEEKEEDIEEKEEDIEEKERSFKEVLKKGAEAVNKIIADFPKKKVELEKYKIKLETKGINSEEATILAFQQILATDKDFRYKVELNPNYRELLVEYKKGLNSCSHKNIFNLNREKLSSSEAKLLESGESFIRVESKPEDLGLLTEKVFTLYEEQLSKEITVEQYGMTFDQFVEFFATDEIPSKYKENFEKIQLELIIPLIGGLTDSIATKSNQIMVQQARNGIYRYIQSIFMVPTDNGYMGNMLNMNLDADNIDGTYDNYSFSNQINYNGIPINIGIDADGNISMTNYISSEKGGYSVGEDLQINNLFQGISINELLDSCPTIDMKSILGNAKSIEEIQVSIQKIIQSYIEKTLAQKVGDLNNAKIEMSWEMEKQVTLNKFIKAYKPPMPEYRFGGGLQITKDKNKNFYNYLKMVDKTVNDASTEEMREFQRVIGKPQIADLFRISGLEGVGTMDIIEELNLLKGTITKKLDIRKIREFSRNLLEQDVDKLNIIYDMDGKEFKKEGGKIYIDTKTTGGLVSRLGEKVKKFFG